MDVKKVLSMVLLTIVLLSPASLAGAGSGGGGGVLRETLTGGDITSDTTWGPSGSPYLVTENLTVASGATLRILPGVEVRCARNVTITVLGRIVVEGVEGNSVVFRANGTGTWEGIRIGGGGWMNHTVIRETRMGLTVFNNSTFWMRYSSITLYTSRQITCVENSTLYLLATPLNTDSANITGGRVYERNPLTVKVLKDVDMSPFEGAMVKMWGDGKLFFASEGWGGRGPKTNSSGVISGITAPYRNHEGRVNLSAVSIRIQAFAMDVNHTWTAQRSGIIADEEKEVVLLFDFTPPPAPSNFTARGTGGDTIELRWSLNHPDAVQIQVFMNASSGPRDFTIIARVSPAEGHYTVMNLAEETTYYFVLRASDLVPNYSPMTPVVSATTLDVTPPKPPENLSAERGEDFLKVSWDPSPSPDVTGYSVYLNTTTNLLANLSSEVRNYNITGLYPDTEYTIFVVAWDDATPSPLPSTPALLKVRTLDTIPPPAPVYNYTLLGEIFQPESGYLNLSGVLLKGKVPGEEWALVIVYLNGVEVVNATAHRENFTVFVNFVPGENRIYLQAMDPAGNIGPKSREISFFYDPDPPQIEVEGIPEAPTSPFNLNAHVNVTDSSPIHSFSWLLQGPGVNRSGEGGTIEVEG
ncbi:MAG: fibronectin type III domain-containing protein, partial [Thermoplasmata archaeon]|nr:fibronectin type III domain-containing protein [Thermoplasmata archaeon]